METVTVTELKERLPEILRKVIAGDTIAITYGNKLIAQITPEKAKNAKKPKRKIGILDGKAKVMFGPSWKMTEEEFLGMD